VNTSCTDRARGARRLGPALGLAALLAGCAHGAVAPAPAAEAPGAAPESAAAAASDNAPAGSPASPYRPMDSIPPGTIVHVATGREVTFDQMMDIIGDDRVVYVGEMHNNASDHEIELRVLKALAARHPGGLMVGMEMFSRDAQKDLDDWLAGRMDPDRFLHLYYDNWSEYYGYYRDILEFCKASDIPIVALNADTDEVRATSRGERNRPEDWAAEGWDGKDPYHHAYLDAVMGGHGHGAPGRFYAVQLLWEETMAQAAYDALTAPWGKDRQLLVLAGAGHVQYGFGVPRRLFNRLPVSYATVVPFVQELPENRSDLRMDVEMPQFPLPVADFAWAVPFKDLEAGRVRLGVRIEPDEKGLRVTEVAHGSAAETAGVKAGDILVDLDGRSLTDMADVQAALTLAHPGGRGTLVVERAGAQVRLTVPYRTAAAQGAPG
jgi:uncharacterized iron-regulated protein